MRPSRKFGQLTDQGPTPGDVALPPALPYPDGWAALAFSAELRPGTVLTRRFAGEDVVLYRQRDGRVRAVRPYCPHLGAHLGLAKLAGNDLVCPFHRFAFGPDGRCVRTGYGTPPPKASLTHLPVHEVNDAVFVWRHHDGREPDWNLPAWHRLGNLPARHASWEMAGYAQDVMENAVDVGHFQTLHGWSQGELAAPVTFDGVTFHVSMRVQEQFPLIGRRQVDIEVDGYGLSCLHTDIHTPALGLRMCSLVMATMTAPGRMQFRQASRFLVTEPTSLPPALARAVSRSVTRLLAGPMFRFSCEFTAADFPIWSTKQYLARPRLASGDGPIGPFRRWSRQFYPPTPGGPLPLPTTPLGGHQDAEATRTGHSRP